MKLLGILLAVAGWLLPVIGLTLTSSTGVRMFLCILGIAITLTGILSVLNKAHQKEAVWKR
jgi:predicted phage tail protein